MNTVFRLHKAEKNNYHSSRGYNKIIHGAVQAFVVSVLSVIVLCCSAYAVNIDATVPASLPITVSSDGTVTTATNAAIRNYGSSPIIVSSINVTAQNGWSLVTKDEAAAAAVGDKVISMGVNGSWMDASGAIDTSSFNRVAASNSLAISYEAKVPGAMTTETESSAATATFVVKLPVVPTMAVGSSWYKSSENRNTITQISFMDSYTPSTEADETWFADEDDTGEITCYRTGTEIIVSGNGTGRIQANVNSSKMFYWYSGLININLSALDTSKVTNMSSMFEGCSKLANIDFSTLDTSEVTNMSGMFYYCKNLTNIDLSSFNTSNVTRMDWMFAQCNKLTSIDLSVLDMSKVTVLYYMFQDCSKLTSINLSNLDTSKVTNMSNMFAGCSGLTNINLSALTTSIVTDMSSMFHDCSGLTSIDVTGFDTSNVTNMDAMFYGCSGLTNINLSRFETSNVTDMECMFCICTRLTSIDLSSFNTSNVTDMHAMFEGCINSTTIYASNKWNTDKVTNSLYMFDGCEKLKGDITFDSSYIDKTYAKTSGGYLTYKAAASKTLSLSIDPNTGTVTSYDVFSSPIEQFRTTLIRSKMATAA